MISEILMHGAIYGIIGVFAGLMAGTLGIGGGIVVVPGLLFLFQLTQLVPEAVMMQVASGTSLTIMIFTSLAALRAHFRMGEILWGVFNTLWPGIILGTIIGAILAEFIPTYWLQLIFALFLLFIAFKMFMDRKTSHAEKFPKPWLNRLISSLIGFKSGLLGVGGGVLIIPYLTYCGVAARKIAAVSSLCTLSVGTVGAIVFMSTGQHEMASIVYATGYVYWPAVLWIAIPSVIIAPLGAKLNYFLPVHQLKYGLIVILILTAIKMLF